MRVLIDASAASTGGLATYTKELVRAWSLSFAEDDVHVFCPNDWAGAHLLPRGTTIHGFCPGKSRRAAARLFGLARIARQVGPDAVLCLLPLVPLSRVRAPLAVVVHDLRHEIRPREFPFSARLARGIEYRRAFLRADRVIAISCRTHFDLIAHHRRTARKSCVVYSGADHYVANLGTPKGATRFPTIIAFGHHSNKRPDLALRAFASLRARIDCALTIIGLNATDVGVLAALARDLHVPDTALRLLPSLNDSEFSDVFGAADVLLFVSSFEGFGLPVLEAMVCRITVVSTPEQAVREIGGEFVTVATSESPDDIAEAVVTALQKRADAGWLDAAAAHAATFTWSRTASEIRRNLFSLG